MSARSVLRATLPGMPASPPIDRSFVRLAEGLIHYRHAGLADDARQPLYLAHAGPGCSRGLEPLMEALAGSRPLIAPDMPGNGDSAPPLAPPTDIAYYAEAAVRLLDALGIERVDFYGSHTGACIGMELALAFPDRIGALVLDGVMLASEAERAEMLERYAPAITPDLYGSHLAWAHAFMRDMGLFFPYYARDEAHRIAGGAVPSAEALHAAVVDVLKALGSYHHAYRAAFAYPAAERLPQLACPVLLTATMRDPLHPDLAKAAVLLPRAQARLLDLAATSAERAAMIAAFLEGEEQAG